MSFDIASGLNKNKPRKKKAQLQSIYDRQREEETLRNAMNRGYLRRMTIEFLNENVGLQDRDLPTVGYLNITSQQLSSVGALEMCISLRICILPGNYITEFDALGSCRNLWALDLHGNQIKKVPVHTFWSSLDQLQILLLHDNGISKLETIHHLSSSPSLLILTLYDTPLSLKKNYRHHVVNGIWSLKALDFHVVSDEEIIEDSKMSSRFAAMQRNFKIDLTHTLTKESSLQEAVKHMEELKTKVNKIQAKYCPVLVIQKQFRMHHVRKRFKYLMATRVWAATSIQRFYRYYKGITYSREDVVPPPTSPLPSPGYEPQLHYNGSIPKTDSDNSGGLSHDDSGSSQKAKDSSINVPLGDYLSGGNVSIAEEFSCAEIPHKTSQSSDVKYSGTIESNQSSYEHSLPIYAQISHERSMPGSIGHRISYMAATSDDGHKKVTRRMTIDLVKLESSTTSTIQSATYEALTGSGLGLDKKSNKSKESKSKTSVNIKDESIIVLEHKKRDEVEQDDAVNKRRLKPEMVGKYRTVRVFLGQVVEPKAKTVDVADNGEDETSGFRLLGEEPPKQKNEPIAEMLLSKREMGEDVRKSLRQFCRKQPEKRKKGKKGVAKLTNDQKLFLRTHGTMGLACIRAVHQAYRDRARAQRQTDLCERVSEMKERRELGKERLETMKQEYQENILTKRIQDGVKIADSLRDHEHRQNEERRKVSERREAAKIEDRIRQSHLAFAREFVCQQNSVSQALRHHDRAELKKEKMNKIADAVSKERESCLERQSLVKRYMEHRRLVNQAELSKAKAEINARLQHDANKQLKETEDNMKRAKMRHTKVDEVFALPPLNAPIDNTPLAILSPAKWEECLQRDSAHFDDSFSNSDFYSENVC